jgi:hypothetical protein
MKFAAVFIALALLQQSSGCDQSPKPVEPPRPIKHYPPIHRFENVSGVGVAGVALDTVTGQYCKTWEWAYKSNAQNGGLDLLPTCLSIYQGTQASEETAK